MTTGSRRRLAVAALILLALGSVASGCETGTETDTAQESGQAAHANSTRDWPDTARPTTRHRDKAKSNRRRVGTAAYMLRRIKTRAESSRAPYRREYFGAWEDQHGCTTRQLVLINESRRGSDIGCHVRHGLWVSTYDGRRTRNPSNFDIDHLVPLGEAWVSGASRWSAGTRKRYANDLGYSGTLRAVSATSNRAKGDADPASWMPPRRIHRCKYIGTWIAVKYRWHLTSDRSERSVLSRYVRDCGRKSDVPIPRRATVRISKRPLRPARVRGEKKGGHRFATCADAKAHGFGPYLKGRDRQYRWYEDRDNDGIVCE